MHQEILTVSTPGRGLVDFTADIRRVVRDSGVATGIAHVFVLHTSASLTVQENADPDVLFDLNGWFTRTVEDGDRHFRHTEEGPDDMSAHVRASLTDTSLSLPVRDGSLLLGTWQAVYLFEHRTRPYERRVVVTVQG
ncbi:MAG: YjbQ family protein [Deltaproteobacteria bacterium]|nr:MAG: YjbQ family protein [Deltaproteobacteria bacterium]